MYQINPVKDTNSPPTLLNQLQHSLTAFWNSTILTTLPPSIAANCLCHDLSKKNPGGMFSFALAKRSSWNDYFAPWKNLKCLHHLFVVCTSYHRIPSFPMFFSEWLILKPFQFLFTPSSISWLKDWLVVSTQHVSTHLQHIRQIG